ncbi:MAG: UPF0175 family protein [Opitutaceae bacterium]|nr:UPF0175 family protein [Opitutaceae bacterium]
MNTLAIQVPEPVLLQSGQSRDELAREAQMELAFHYFRSGKLTSGQAAEMAGMGRVDFILAAGTRNIPVADLDDEDWKRELAALSSL